MSMQDDLSHMRTAIGLALAAERAGNLPVGAVVVMEGRVIAEGGSSLLHPLYDPRGHAEMNALDRVDGRLWRRAAEMTVYTTLEPCCMCFGRILLADIGRVVFGALDPNGGAGCLMPHLPPYYRKGHPVPVWQGPLLPGECDPLFQRALAAFRRAVGEA